MNSLHQPPEITAFDHYARGKGIITSIASLHPAHLRTTKKTAAVTESTRIIELTRENGSLRQELARANDVLRAWGSLYGILVEAYRLLKKTKEMLQEGLQAVAEKRADSDAELLQYWAIDIESGDDIRIL